ncbi:MAG: peptidyl-tRNA hydrolase [Undibacterium sp.]
MMTPLKQVIVVRRDLKLGRGKEAAQVAHASIFAAMQMMSPRATANYSMTGC